jgi:hypothetical protein
MTLFWFLTPLLQAIKMMPKTTGINAVIEGLSEFR